jgi:hypothetical protein
MGVREHRRTRREVQWAFEEGKGRDRRKKVIPQKKERKKKELPQPKKTLMLQGKNERLKVANRGRIVNQ